VACSGIVTLAQTLVLVDSTWEALALGTGESACATPGSRLGGVSLCMGSDQRNAFIVPDTLQESILKGNDE